MLLIHNELLAEDTPAWWWLHLHQPSQLDLLQPKGFGAFTRLELHFSLVDLETDLLLLNLAEPPMRYLRQLQPGVDLFGVALFGGWRGSQQLIQLIHQRHIFLALGTEVTTGSLAPHHEGGLALQEMFALHYPLAYLTYIREEASRIKSPASALRKNNGLPNCYKRSRIYSLLISMDRGKVNESIMESVDPSQSVVSPPSAASSEVLPPEAVR